MENRLQNLSPVIESIQDTKMVHEHHYSLVKFLGYEEEFNQWVPTKQLRQMKMTKLLRLKIRAQERREKHDSVSRSTRSQINTVESSYKSGIESCNLRSKFSDLSKNIKQIGKENLSPDLKLGKRSQKVFKKQQEYIKSKLFYNPKKTGYFKGRLGKEYFRKLLDEASLFCLSQPKDLTKENPDDMIMKRLKSKLKVRSAKMTPKKSTLQVLN